MFSELTARNIATLISNGTAIFLLVGVFLETGIMRKRKRPDDIFFFGIVVLNIILAVFDSIAYLVDGKEFSGSNALNIGSNTVYFFVLILMVMAWFQYSLLRFRGIGGSEAKKYLPLFIPGVIDLLLIIVNIFMGWVFYMDEECTYHHGTLYVPMFAVIVYFIILSLVPVFRYRVGSDKKKLIPIWIFILPIVAAFIVPFVLGGISLTPVGIALVALFAHLGSASEMVNYDAKEGKTV